MSGYLMPNIEEFVNDLDESDLITALEVIAAQDEVEMIDGKPRWNGDEISMIMKVRAVLANNTDDDED